MEKLKRFRRARGLTQSEMAEKIGFTLSMYEKVERERARASSAFMWAFKSAFPDADMDDIFFGTISNDVAGDKEA